MASLALGKVSALSEARLQDDYVFPTIRPSHDTTHKGTRVTLHLPSLTTEVRRAQSPPASSTRRLSSCLVNQ